VGYAIGDDVNREAFHIADGLVPGLAITHYTRQFQSFGNSATIVFTIQVDCQIHPFSILQTAKLARN
jgi:hypothetical protein